MSSTGPGPYPSRFVRTGATVLRAGTKDGEKYTLTSELGGRGQAGKAGFYRSNTVDVLIKDDDLGTCLMEGTAHFVDDAGLIPPALAHTVNCAYATSVEDVVDGSVVVASIQSKVKQRDPVNRIVPWDEVVLGHKRNPTDLFSAEYWNSAKIDESISRMSSAAQWELAAAIFASECVGDESLHVGQFMAEVNPENEVVGIVRIDLGARGRYAHLRQEGGHFDPFHASAEYTSKGQIGKDYVSFVLQNPSLQNKLGMLWTALRREDENALKERIQSVSMDAFLNQLNNVPDALKTEALQSVLNILYKGSENESKKLPEGDLTEQAYYVALKVAAFDAQRVIEMRKKETPLHLNYLEKLLKIVSLGQHRANLEEVVKFTRELVLTGPTDDSDQLYQQHLNTIQNVISEKLTDKDWDSVSLLSQIAIDMVEAVDFELHYKKDDNKENALDECSPLVAQFQTIADLADYAKTRKKDSEQENAAQQLCKTLNESPKDFMQQLVDVKRVLEARRMALGLAMPWNNAESKGALLVEKITKRFKEAPLIGNRVRPT